MKKLDTPFPKHWLCGVATKLIVVAGAPAIALKLFDVW